MFDPTPSPYTPYSVQLWNKHQGLGSKDLLRKLLIHMPSGAADVSRMSEQPSVRQLGTLVSVCFT